MCTIRMRGLVVAAAVALAGAVPAYACGPDFPQELLTNRQTSLLALPEGRFDYEVMRLVRRGDALRAIEPPAWDEGARGKARDDAEREGLAATQIEALAAARAQPDAAAAFAAGAALPPAPRHYVAGAVAFAHAALDAAREHFAAILALDAEARRPRETWAHFMLGRTARFSGDAAAAREHFAATRAAALAGAPDPLGLAVASYGEEAYVELGADNDARAVALYAEQAARGSAGAAASLLFVARSIVADDQRLQAGLDDALTQRLLVAYAFARPAELESLAGDGSYDPYAATDDTGGTATDDPHGITPVTGPRIAALLEALATRDDVAGKDRLAALAYRAGRFDLAARLAANDPAPLSAWLRAKLALRAGDAEAAAREYTLAIAGFPTDERWMPADGDDWTGDAVAPACRTAGERGLLALSRDDFGDAMRYLWLAADEYWADAAYVAERVLTVDELRAFVDAEVKAPAAATPSDGGATVDIAVRHAHALRALLARRLLRADRRAEALAYFDDAATREAAQAYVAARDAADADKAGVAAAAQWWRAAATAREHGMAILGFELDPDYALHDGSFDLNSPGRWDEATSTWVVGPRTDIVVAGPFTSDGERARVTQSAAKPLQRFHYRDFATTLAERAADLVPARSQAFAAMLCEAAGWVLDDEPARGRALWWRYVKQGPYVPWAADFGNQCQAPDFAAAQARADLERQRELRRMARRAAPYAAAVMAVVVIVAVVAWRRRRRSPHPPA